jgi:hypothetical protein
MGPQPRLGLNMASRPPLRRRIGNLLAALAASLILPAAPAILAAAPPAHPASTHRASDSAHHQPRANAPRQPAPRSTPPAQAAAPTPPQPAQPATPDWPANNPPRPAAVVLNSHGLSIEADNSSLKQILNSVSAATGASIDGLSSDQRIFGSYGPGRVRDVLSQLLDGSGYNVMIVGGQDRDTPLHIVLSALPKGPASPAPGNSASSGGDDSSAQQLPQPYPPSPPLIRPGNGIAPPRTPQQIMQEMRQRQEMEQREQQMREQQQN